MKLTQLLLGLLFLNTSYGAYQPGTPGAPWSEETASIIREKLFQVWRKPGLNLLGYSTLFGCKGSYNKVLFSILAKMLTLEILMPKTRSTLTILYGPLSLQIILNAKM